MKANVPYDLRDISQDIVKWADEVFPARTPEGTIQKMLEELEELRANPMDAWEMADVLILMIDLCDMLGFDPAKLIHNKMRVNKSRTWEVKNGVMHHVKVDETDEQTSSANSEALDDSSHNKTTKPSGAQLQRGPHSTGDLRTHGDFECKCYEGSTCTRLGRDSDGGHTVAVQKACRVPQYGDQRFVFSGTGGSKPVGPRNTDIKDS